MDKVIDHLYISDWESAKNLEGLHFNDIKYVISIGTGSLPDELVENAHSLDEEQSRGEIPPSPNSLLLSPVNSSSNSLSGKSKTVSFPSSFYGEFFEGADSRETDRERLPTDSISADFYAKVEEEEGGRLDFYSRANAESLDDMMAVSMDDDDRLGKLGMFSSSRSLSVDRGLTSPSKDSTCTESKHTVTMKNGIHYLSYTSILDSPEVVILDILKDTNKFISNAIRGKKNVLVHCVHGQSRSAMVVLGYLMNVGMEVRSALELLATSRPSININPGFLCQICFLHIFGYDSPEFKLLTYNPATVVGIQNNSFEERVFVHQSNDSGDSRESLNGEEQVGDKRKECSTDDNLPSDERSIICKSCKHVLFTDRDRLSSYPANEMIVEFMEKNVDEFWKGYQPTTYSSKKKQTVGPIAGSILLGPVRWIIEQMQNCNNRYFSKGDLECPHCSLQCGSWERKSLCILGVFNPVDLFAINETVVRIKRRQKLRVALEGKAVTRFATSAVDSELQHPSSATHNGSPVRNIRVLPDTIRMQTPTISLSPTNLSRPGSASAVFMDPEPLSPKSASFQGPSTDNLPPNPPPRGNPSLEASSSNFNSISLEVIGRSTVNSPIRNIIRSTPSTAHVSLAHSESSENSRGNSRGNSSFSSDGRASKSNPSVFPFPNQKF